MLTWPNWPMKMRTSSSQEEGVERDFAVMTQRFEGEDGQVTALHCVRVDDKMQPIEGTEFELKADLVLLAMGFLGPVQDGMIKDLGVDLDKRGNVAGRHRPSTRRASTRCSPAATCAAASRWSSGRSARAASAPAPSTSS